MTESNPESSPRAKPEPSLDCVPVSRRSITLIAWSVPLLVITAFLFGLMVGQLTANPRTAAQLEATCEIFIELSRRETPSPVAMLLPTDAMLRQKLSPASILPQTFQPLNNPTIDGIIAEGGAISRVPDSGTSLSVTAHRSYWLVVLYPTSTKSSDLTRQQTAGLSQYFLPLDELTRAGDIHLELIRIDEKPLRIKVPD